MAFNIRDKQQRIPLDDPGKKYKFDPKKYGKTADEMKANVTMMKTNRLNKVEKAKTDSSGRYASTTERENLRKMHEQMRKEKKSGKGNAAEPEEKKIFQVTFENIEKMHFTEFNSNAAGMGGGLEEDEFKPSDIIDEDEYENPSESDEEILKKFKQQEKQRQLEI